MDSIMSYLSPAFTQFRRMPLRYISTGVLIIPSIYYTGQAIRSIYDFWHFCRAMKDIQGPETEFIWGNMKDHPVKVNPKDPLGVWLNYCSQYEDEPFFRFWLGPVHCLVVFYNPEAVRAILKSDEPKSLEVGAPYRMIQPWLGNGLLLASGALWFRNRRLLTPAFHFDILKPYVDIYNDSADILLKKWSHAARSGTTVQLFNDISLLTLDIILRCAFSSENDIQSESTNEYVSTMRAIAQCTVDRGVNVFLYPDILYGLSKQGRRFAELVKYTHEVADDVIASRRKVLAEGGKTRERHLDFLDILLTARDEDGQGLTDVQIRDEVNTFLFEGHDTTASAISWLIYALATHPECQDKVRAELKDVLNGSTEVDWDDLGNFPYLTMCIKETLRCYAAVPFIARQLSKDMTVCGKLLPKGTRISIPIYALHHNKTVWGEDHMEFIPERFTPENQRTMDPFAFVPFSAGPRNCIGQNFAMHEIKVSAVKIFRRFHVQIAPGQHIIPRASVVLRAIEDIQLSLTEVAQ